MPSKEHLALKFDICTILQSAKPDETARTADLILSTVRAALEPTDEMLAVPYKYRDLRSIIRDVIAASALGEQSE